MPFLHLHFALEEISVTVHGKRADNSYDRGCYVKLKFKPRYVLPEDDDPETVKCHSHVQRTPGARGSEKKCS